MLLPSLDHLGCILLGYVLPNFHKVYINAASLLHFLGRYVPTYKICPGELLISGARAYSVKSVDFLSLHLTNRPMG